MAKKLQLMQEKQHQATENALLAERLEEEFRRGRDYQRAMGFTANWQEYEQMKIGQQWPAVSRRTKHLPRPVFNILELLINHKTAQLLNENIRMIFSPEGPDIDSAMSIAAAEYYSALAEETWRQSAQATLNEQVMDTAATYGAGIWHYYWDNGIRGGNHKYWGGLAGETLDPANCFFGNPQQLNVQKQPWILIAKREDISAVKESARKNGLAEGLINADKRNLDNMSEAARTELTSHDKVTVLTEYRRGADGGIWFAKSAAGVLVQPLTPLGLSFYPLEVMNWKLRKNSIYGIGEVEGIIPNQKAINFLMAMMMLSVQDTAWPKLIAKPGALNQQLTNMPGEVVVDNYPVGEGIRYLSGAPLSGSALALADKIYELTRSIGGANQVSTGEIYTSTLSGAAIMALQRASAIPVDQIRKRFMRSLVNIGRIWEDFFKRKYIMERPLLLTDTQGGQRLCSITASDYATAALALKIDVGAAADYSEALMMSNIENFLAAGHITFEEALEFMPDAAVPFREAMLRRIRARHGGGEQSDAQLKTALAQLLVTEQGASPGSERS